MSQRVESANYKLNQFRQVEDDFVMFYIQDKRTGQTTYFRDINGKWLMRDDVESESHVSRRAGSIPEDIPAVIVEQLNHIRENGQMQTPHRDEPDN